MTLVEAQAALGKLVRHQPASRKWGMYGKLTEVRSDGTGVMLMGANLAFTYPIAEMTVIGEWGA